jgi:hypothetical protein
LFHRSAFPQKDLLRVPEYKNSSRNPLLEPRPIG